jgi:hypothetical protein
VFRKKKTIILQSILTWRDCVVQGSGTNLERISDSLSCTVSIASFELGELGLSLLMDYSFYLRSTGGVLSICVIESCTLN